MFARNGLYELQCNMTPVLQSSEPHPVPAQGPLSRAERFELVAEAIRDYAIYMLDPEGRIESWNQGAERIKGYRADEVLGKSYSIFFRPDDLAEGLPKWQLERARLHGKTEEEGWRMRKDGTAFWASILLSAIRDADGTLIGFAKVTRDITERRQLRELEHSLKRMNEFLAMLGHELRGPLAPMQGALAYLGMRQGMDDKQLAAYNILDRQLSHLTRLLDGLLDSGRLTSGKLQIAPTRIDFHTVVAQAVALITPTIQARHQQLQVALADGPMWGSVDELRLLQVLQNLLLNASKFTPPGGQVKLRAIVTDHRLIVDVTDDGVGMDPATVDDLFHLFVQGPRSSDANLSGLGIGLALARSIVEMHGGKIFGSSEGLGKGSNFQFELPGFTHEASA